MLDTLSRIFKTQNATAAQLRAASEGLDLDAAQRAVADAEKRRRAALLDGDPTSLKAAETALTEARLAAERMSIAREELIARADAADAREAEERESAERKRVDNIAAAAAQRLKRDYDKTIKALLALRDEIAAADRAVSVYNTTRVAGPVPSTGFLKTVKERLADDPATAHINAAFLWTVPDHTGDGAAA